MMDAVILHMIMSGGAVLAMIIVWLWHAMN